MFFHDVFLLLNLAAPGSFGGTVSISGGELRVREMAFRPRVFQYAAGLARVPIENVADWYEIATQQLASGGAMTALFQLLHLARSEEDEEQSILRLCGAAEALRKRDLERLFALREEIARGRMPVIHPMHDDGLDPRVQDVTAELIDVADEAATAVVAALQEFARAHGGA